MAFTKVVGPGIHTLAQLRTHNIHSAGIITATKFVGEMESGGGESTFQNVTVQGNLTVQGDQTTLNTTLRNVELLRVAADSDTTYAGIITQTGTGNILGLFDGSTRVFNVADGGAISTKSLTVTGDIEVVDTTPRIKITDSDASNAYAFIDGQAGKLKLFADLGGNVSNSEIIFGVDSSTPKMVIKDTGHVGIGTDNAGRILTIRSSEPRIRLMDDDTGGHAEIYTDNNHNLQFSADSSSSSGSSQFFFRVNGTEKVRIQEDGDIIYGAGDHIIGGDPALIQGQGSHHNNNMSTITYGINDGGNTCGMRVENFDDGTYNAQRVKFLTAKGGVSMATVRMTIDELGNVGIGSTIPAKKLDVNGTAQFQDDINIKSGNPIILANASNSASTQILCDGGARLHLKSYNQTVATFEEGVATTFYQSSGTNRFQIAKDGGIHVGAGGTIYMPEYVKHSGNTTTYFGFSGDNTFKIYTNDAQRLQINNTGVFQFNHTSVGGYYNFQGPTSDNNWGGYLKLNSYNNSTVKAEIRASTNGLWFQYGDHVRLDIDNDGAINIGHNPAQSTGTNTQNAILTLKGYPGGNESSAAILALIRGYNTTSATADHTIGRIVFGDKQAGEYAFIEGEVEANGAVGDTPGRLVFSTAGDNTSAPTERLRIGSNGSMYLGYNSSDGLPVQDGAVPGNLRLFSIHGTGTSLGIKLTNSTTGTTTSDGVDIRLHGETAMINQNQAYDLQLQSKGELAFRTGSTPAERVRITSGGELQVGSAHTTSTNYGWGPVARFQIETANDPSSIHFGQRAGGSADPALVFLRRGGSQSWVHHAARIYFDTEKFNFETAAPAAPGSHSFGKRMVIKHNGKVGISSDNPQHPLDVAGNIRSYGQTPSLYLQTTANIAESAIIRFGDTGSFQRGAIQYDFGGISHLRFKMGGYGNAVERMTLTGAGCLNLGGDYSQQDDRLHVEAAHGGEAMGIGGTTRGIRFGWDGDRTAYDDLRMYRVDYNNAGTHGIAGNNPTFILTPTSAPGSGIVQETVWLKSTGRGSGNNEMNLMVDGDLVVGGSGKENGVAVSGYPGSRQHGLGVSKLTIQPDDRTTAFNAADGDTWFDIFIKQKGGATNNAAGIAFQVANDNYHKNAGTGIAAVKNGTNSDYGSDLVFITRPQSAVASEKMRITSDGKVLIGRQTASHTSSNMEIYGGGEAYIRISPSTNTGTAGVIFGTADDHSTGGIYYQGSDDALVFAGHNNDEKLRITSGGTVETASSLHVKSGELKVRSSSSAMYYQVISGIKTFSDSETLVGLAYVGHSHSLSVQYMIVENNNTALGGAHGRFDVFTTYGNGTVYNHTFRRNAMNGGRINGDPYFEYCNGGCGSHGNNYVLRARVAYTGTDDNFTIRYVIKGLSAGNMYV